jgi:hypothetical protein
MIAAGTARPSRGAVSKLRPHNQLFVPRPLFFDTAPHLTPEQRELTATLPPRSFAGHGLIFPIADARQRSGQLPHGGATSLSAFQLAVQPTADGFLNGLLVHKGTQLITAISFWRNAASSPYLKQPKNLANVL